jgi:predicted nucleotidyltransferase
MATTAGGTAGVDEETRARLRDLAQVRPDVVLVVLFGSRVRGRARPDSDVDVAVGGGGPLDLDALHLVLAPRFRSDRLDLVDLGRAGSLLAFEIARHGTLLYEREPGGFRAFQSLASRRYGDTAKLRRAQRRAIQAFLGRMGLG